MKVGDLVEHEVFKNVGLGIVVETGPRHATILWAAYSKRVTEAISLVRLVNESR